MTPVHRGLSGGAAEWRRHYFMTPPLIFMPGTSERDAYMDDQYGKDAEPLPNREPLADSGRWSRTGV